MNENHSTIGGVWGERAGKYLLALFFGIVIGSIWYERPMMWMYATGIVALLYVLAWLWRHEHARVVCACVTLLLFGAWHASAYGARFAQGIRPWKPNAVFAVKRGVESTSGWISAQQALRSRIQSMYMRDEASLLGGLLYGENGLDASLKKQVRTAGLMHVLAVSGTNVTLLALMCMRLLMMLRISRRSAYFALVVLTGSFVWLVRPSASVVRAAIMGLLLELAPLVGRVPRPSRLLLIAGVLFAWWHPFSVLYDPGFALSFLAMVGLLWWSPWFDARLKRVIPWDGMREIVSASLGTGLLTAPYGLWLFGMWSAWGLLTGIVILPMIPWLTIAGGASLITPIAPLIWITHMGLRAMLDVVTYVARFPMLVLETNIGFVAMLSSYALCFSWWLSSLRHTNSIHKEAFAQINTRTASVPDSSARE